jgi:hypothetical protein
MLLVLQADAHFSNSLTPLKIIYFKPNGRLFYQHGEIPKLLLISRVMISYEIDSVYPMPDDDLAAVPCGPVPAPWQMPQRITLW